MGTILTILLAVVVVAFWGIAEPRYEVESLPHRAKGIRRCAHANEQKHVSPDREIECAARGLAVQKRPVAQVLAVEIERIQEGRARALPAPQFVELGNTIAPADVCDALSG